MERYLSASAVSSNRSATWRSIRAAKKTRAVDQTVECDPLALDSLDVGYKPGVTMADSSFSDGLTPVEEEGQSPMLSASRLDISEEEKMPISFSEENEKQNEDQSVESFIQSENLCWGGEERTKGKKQRIFDDAIEEDCDFSSLGTVNPDTIMSISRALPGEVSGGLLPADTLRGYDKQGDESTAGKTLQEQAEERKQNRSDIKAAVVGYIQNETENDSMQNIDKKKEQHTIKTVREKSEGRLTRERTKTESRITRGQKKLRLGSIPAERKGSEESDSEEHEVSLVKGK